jgi:predicted transcriptional regulator
MLEHQLSSLGLSEKEIAVYLAVLRQGRVTPTEIAKLTSIQRSTVYSVAKELEEKGLLRIDTTGTVVYLMPPTVETAKRAMEKEENHLLQKRTLLREVMKVTREMQREAPYPLPSVTVITEQELPVYLKRHTPIWNESALQFDKTWWGFQDHTFADQFEEWIDWFWTSVSKEIGLKLFSNQAPIEKKMKKKGYERREIRFWKDATFTGTTWVVGEYVIMIVTDRWPMYLIEIHDVTLARNQALVFEKLWGSC